MGDFGNRVIMPQNGDPRILFESNLLTINAMNVAFLQGQLSYSVAVNAFSALSFTEFARRQSGMGLFANNFTARPQFDNRGNLRFDNTTSLHLDRCWLIILFFSPELNEPSRRDYSEGTCRTKIR